jgi:hypothetical protein
VLSPLILGLLLLGIFLLWEWRYAKAPVLPFRLFQGQGVVALGYLIAFIGGMSYETAQDIGMSLISEV